MSDSAAKKLISPELWENIAQTGHDIARDALGVATIGGIPRVFGRVVSDPNVRAEMIDGPANIVKDAATGAGRYLGSALGWTDSSTAPPAQPPAPPQRTQAPQVPAVQVSVQQPSGQPEQPAPQVQPQRPAAPAVPRGVAAPSYEKELRASYAQQEDALRAQADVEKTRAEQSVVAFAAKEKAALEIEQSQAAMQGAYQRERDEETNTLKKLIADFASPQATPDPGRFWASRTTGQKIAAGIGMVLGIFGSGSRNRGVEALEGAVREDIERQQHTNEQAKARGKELMGMQQNLLSLMRTNFGDDVQALAATRLATFERLETQAQAMAAKLGTPEAEANLKMLLAKTSELKAKDMEAFGHRTHERALQNRKLALEERAFAAREAGAQAGEQSYPANTPPDQLPLDVRKRWVAGVGEALDEDSAKKVRQESGKYRKAVDALEQIRALRDKHGASGLIGEKLAAARSLAAKAQLALADSETLKALGKDSKGALESMVSANPGRIGYELAKLDATIQSLDDSFREETAPYLVSSRPSEREALARAGARPLSK
jgi:hypothetical protein